MQQSAQLPATPDDRGAMSRTIVIAITLLASACTIRNEYYVWSDAAEGDANGDAPDGATSDGPDAGGDPCEAAGGQIVFTTDRDGDTEIAIMLADGSGFQQLTTNTWADDSPVLSPDGTKIAWLSYGSGQPQLFVMDQDGSNVRADVSGGALNEDYPIRWSPSSSSLVFVKLSGSTDVFSVSADGSGLANLTNQSGSDTYPDWSPDGQRIVFRTNRRYTTAASDLFVMNVDGTSQTPITPMISNVIWSSPRWSPQGTLIVAYRQASLQPFELWQITPAGGLIAEVFDQEGTIAEWSPNGEVAFRLNGEILVVSPGTPGSTNLTQNIATDDVPRWSADGSRIAFQTDRDGNQEVYVMNANGSSPMNLTQDPGNDVPGSWSACP
jgi:Tol biopolymer transport system component